MVEGVQEAMWSPMMSPPNPAPHPWVWSVINIDGVAVLGWVVTELR